MCRNREKADGSGFISPPKRLAYDSHRSVIPLDKDGDRSGIPSPTILNRINPFMRPVSHLASPLDRGGGIFNKPNDVVLWHNRSVYRLRFLSVLPLSATRRGSLSGFFGGLGGVMIGVGVLIGYLLSV